MVGLAEAGVAGRRDGGGAVPYADFQHDAGDVVADGLLGQGEPAGDLVVAAAGGDEFEHLPFPLGEVGERGGGVVAMISGAAEWWSVEQFEEEANKTENGQPVANRLWCNPAKLNPRDGRK